MDDRHGWHDPMDKQVNLGELEQPPTECVHRDMPGSRGLKRNYVSVRAVVWMNSFAS